MKAEHPWSASQLGPLLLPPLGIKAPIKDLERLWLETSCYYAVFDDNVMADEPWDQMAVELWKRRKEISPYFAHAVNLPWPVPPGEEGENPLKTASGVNWEEGLPRIVVVGIIKDGPKRMAMWRSRIAGIKALFDRTEDVKERQKRAWPE